MAPMPSPAPVSFSNQLLVALPTLTDPLFARTVALLCQHGEEGAMGVVVNRPSDYALGEVLRQMGIDCEDPALLEQRVLAGGPVHPERGFVIHDGTRGWDSSLAIADGLYVTTSRDILEAIASGEGPDHATVALGCAGWGGGQLEQELAENSWLTAPVQPGILYSLPLEQRWQAAAGGIGVDLMRLAGQVGHA